MALSLQTSGELQAARVLQDAARVWLRRTRGMGSQRKRNGGGNDSGDGDDGDHARPRPRVGSAKGVPRDAGGLDEYKRLPPLGVRGTAGLLFPKSAMAMERSG